MSGPNLAKGVGVTTLAKLFDLTPMRVQQLASAGVVVKVSHGTYALGESVKNYIKFLRERADKTGNSRELAEVKRLIAEEDLKMKKRANAIQDKDVVAADEIRSMIVIACAKWASILITKLETEAPARLIGKDVAEMREEMRVIVDELSEISRGIFVGEIAPEIIGESHDAEADEDAMRAEISGEDADNAEDSPEDR